MAEERLDAAYVRPIAQEMDSEGMPEEARMQPTVTLGQSQPQHDRSDLASADDVDDTGGETPVALVQDTDCSYTPMTYIAAMPFVWDPDQESSDRERHDIDFAMAAQALNDPDAIEGYDADHSQDGEDR